MMVNFRPSSTTACPDCGTNLSGGACPACALQFLLTGGGTEGDGVEEEPSPAVPVEAGSSIEFGRYTLKQRLASGGMGVIYMAEDRKLKRTVALKMIRGSTFANEAELARFTIEAEAAAGLDHPNIVPIYEVGRMEGQPFFTMKLIEGQSLAEMLKKSGGTLRARGAATLLACIARAVHHAHQRGVLHRDLKPGNILIDRDGTPWLTDFGLAKMANADSCLTLTTDHLGTPHYMSPEVAGGKAREVSTASDVWALGVILWEVLCGMPPFHGSSPVEIMRRIVDHEPTWPGGERGDEDLVTLARRCMEKEPGKRPVSAGEVAEELERWLRGEPIRARRITRRERLAKWVKRKPALAALYAALTLGGVASLVLWQRAEQAVVSLTQTNDQLETALRIATATKLAGDARFQIAEDPARALLLAVEAVKTTQETLGGVLPEATTALYDVLQQTGGRDISPFPMEKSSAVPGFLKRMIFEENGAKISPDGKWLLTLDWTETHKNGIRAALFDLEDRNGTEPVRRWEMWPSPGEENFRGISWLGDSRRVLSGNLSGEVILWNVTEASAEGRMTGTPPSRVLGKVDTAGLAFRSGTLRSRPGETTADYYTYFRKAGNDGTDHDSFCLATRFSADGIPVAAKPVRLALPAGMGQPSSTVSPDGKWLLTCRADGAGPGYFQRIGPEGASEPAVLPEGSFAVGPRAFSPDSKSLVLQRSAALARVYDLSSGDPVKAAATGRTLSTGVEGCTLIAFSPDSSQVCMVGVGDVVQLQPLDPSKPVYKLRTAGGRGVATAFSPDGRWLFAGGVDRVVRAWRVDRLSEGEPPLEFRGLSSPVMDLAMTRDGRTLVATGIYSSYRRWDFDGFTTGTVPFTCAGGQGSIRDVAVSPDSKWLAMACTSAEGAPDVGPEGEVLLSEPASKKVWNLKSHGGPATGVAFSPDGKWLVSIGSDARAYVYDFREMCRCIHDEHQLPGPVDTLDMTGTRQNYIRRVAVHPRGTLYCTCGDGILFGWDLNAPHPSLTKKEHPIHSIQYLLPDVQVSPDGHWLAVARHGWDREPVKGSDQNGNLVLVYDVSQPGPPVPRATLRAPFLERTSLTFTADSRWLASGSSGQFPVIWDLAAPNPAATARTAPCQDHSMEGVSFSPDRPWLAMAGAEGRIYLWDWEKTGELRTIATDEAVHTLKWLPGGRLLSGGSKGQTQLWETDFQSLIALANKVAGRRLTEEERSKFRVTGSGGKH